MTYQDTLSWMFQQLPMYQNKGQTAYKEDLSNSLILDEYLGFPHKRFKSIHVAGTNGKGSTSHMLASILQEAGYKVGLYTSPHLKDFRERIKINGTPIGEGYVVDFIDRNKTFFEEYQLSFFEMTVGLAFEYFSNEMVDIAIIEVGLGGRLDSTNIITPILSVITNIGYDHVAILGNTLAKIAFEKAGIIKPKIPVVIGETLSETKTVFNHKASVVGAKITFAEDFNFELYDSDLKGVYQEKNKRTALTSIKILSDIGLKISEKHMRQGLLHVVKNTGLLGRWQILGKDPKIICDTAHNKEGLEIIFEQLLKQSYNHLHIVLGTVNDKRISELLDIFPKSATYYFCKPNIPRGKDASELASLFENKGYVGVTYNSVKEAFIMAQNAAANNDLIFVGGSTFVVAEVL